MFSETLPPNDDRIDYMLSYFNEIGNILHDLKKEITSIKSDIMYIKSDIKHLQLDQHTIKMNISKP